MKALSLSNRCIASLYWIHLLQISLPLELHSRPCIERLLGKSTKLSFLLSQVFLIFLCWTVQNASLLDCPANFATRWEWANESFIISSGHVIRNEWLVWSHIVVTSWQFQFSVFRSFFYSTNERARLMGRYTGYYWSSWLWLGFEKNLES